MEAIEPAERLRLIEEALKGRDNVIRYNLQGTSMLFDVCCCLFVVVCLMLIVYVFISYLV